MNCSKTNETAIPDTGIIETAYRLNGEIVRYAEEDMGVFPSIYMRKADVAFYATLLASGLSENEITESFLENIKEDMISDSYESAENLGAFFKIPYIDINDTNNRVNLREALGYTSKAVSILGVLMLATSPLTLMGDGIQDSDDTKISYPNGNGLFYPDYMEIFERLGINENGAGKIFEQMEEYGNYMSGNLKVRCSIISTTENSALLEEALDELPEAAVRNPTLPYEKVLELAESGYAKNAIQNPSLDECQLKGILYNPACNMTKKEKIDALCSLEKGGRVTLDHTYPCEDVERKAYFANHPRKTKGQILRERDPDQYDRLLRDYLVVEKHAKTTFIGFDPNEMIQNLSIPDNLKQIRL